MKIDIEKFKEDLPYRIKCILIAGSFFALTELGRFVYRPYIYKNDINDYGLADSVGNLFGIIVQIYFMLGITAFKGRKAYFWVLIIMIGYIVYEYLQPYLPKGVFDIKDVYGSIIGAFIAIIILFFLLKHEKMKKRTNDITTKE